MCSWFAPPLSSFLHRLIPREKLHVDIRASTPAQARVARALLLTHLKSRAELLRLEQSRRSMEGSLSAFEVKRDYLQALCYWRWNVTNMCGFSCAPRLPAEFVLYYPTLPSICNFFRMPIVCILVSYAPVRPGVSSENTAEIVTGSCIGAISWGSNTHKPRSLGHSSLLQHECKN